MGLGAVVLIGTTLAAASSMAQSASALPRTQPPAVDTVVVTAPTVIAAFAVTQPQVDSHPDVAEALADFRHYLPGVRDSVRALGAEVVERYDSLIPIRVGSIRSVWRVRADSGGVGYLFVAPDRGSHTIWGVRTDIDLLEAFTKFLAKR